MGQFVDEAGNLWNVDANGNPVFAGRVNAQEPQPVTLGRPDPKAAYEAPRAAADLAKTQQDMELAREEAERKRREWNATHNPDGTPKTQLTKQQLGLARAKLGNLTAIENQIRRVEQALDAAETKGFTGPFWGRLPGTGAFDPESAVLDKSIAQLAPLIRQLTRVPGEGAMTDYESRLAQMSLPSRADNPAAVREAISGLRDLIGQTSAGYREMLGEQGGMDKSSGLTTNQPGGDQRELATGATRDIPDPKANALVTRLIRAGVPDDEINAALRDIGAEPVTPDSLKAIRAFEAKHPGSSYSGAKRTVPTTLGQRMAASPVGTGFGNAMVAGSFGLPILAAGQDAKEAFDLASEANPKSAFAGSLVGGITGMKAGGALLGKAPGLAAWMARNPVKSAVAGDLLYGGSYGANTADEGLSLIHI